MAKGTGRLRQRLKLYFDLIYNERLRIHVLQAFPFWLASLVTGLVAVGYSHLFSYSENLLHYLLSWHQWLIFILAPACFFIAWWIVQRFSPNAKGSGIPQVMAAIELTSPRNIEKADRLLSLRVIITKIASSLMMVLGGGAIGREGPTIQIAGSIFRIINKWIPENWPKLSKQSFILTGAAAGLAAAFNTPLGGVVFAMEELSKIHIRFFRTALFTAVIIAGLTAQGLIGPYLYLGYPDIGNTRISLFMGVLATAVLSGLGGSAMSSLILKVMRWKNSFKKKSKVLVFLFVSALIIAIVAFFISNKVLGSGKDLMTTVLFTNNKHEEWYIPLLRTGGIVVSFTTGAAGGVFAPSLAAGASIGAWFAGIFSVIGSNANILILCGMVGFLTGVTRTPFTSAILVLEMTDRHSIIFHLMLAAMIANLVSLLVDKHSLYDHLKNQYLQEMKDDSITTPSSPELPETEGN